MIEKRNPRDGSLLYTLEIPAEQDIAETYNRAHAAAGTLRKSSVESRAAAMADVQHYIAQHRKDIMDRIVEETGKCRGEALTSEIFVTLDCIDYFRKQAPAMLRDEKVSSPLFMFGKKSRIYYEPFGVVLVISPWNYPFFLGIVPIISAFLAGNAVVYKPSEITPLRGVFEDVFGCNPLTENAIQIVYGARETGQALIEARPDKIFFTGSVRGGKAVMRQAAEQLIPVELELGGKDPMIVFDDVDIDKAVEGALWGALTNAGQTCTSVERLYVQESIYDAFLARLQARFGDIRTPDDTLGEHDIDLGSLTAPFQANTIQEHLADAIARGASVLTGGAYDTASMVFQPTLLSGVTSDMKIMTEETFGPVLPISRFSTEEEVIALANATDFGLAASVWSRDLMRAERVARALTTGNVSINNVMTTLATARLPFGGIKNSGYGRYKGPGGLHTFCNVKSVVIEPMTKKREAHWYPHDRKKFELFERLMLDLYGGSASIFRALITGLKLERYSNRKL
ncbi:MAG: aldehyde dehydrogenase family protein [Candidatus Hydrogenedentes bacterium]|nr:aldehyde dehydrogenase family protein [Candidatus Hydrogenedentota bacterium]